MSCFLLPFTPCFTSLMIYKSKMSIIFQVRKKGILLFPRGLWKTVCELLQYSKFPQFPIAPFLAAAEHGQS